MSKSDEYVAQVQSLDWAELRDLWKGICQGSTPDWAPGRAMEHLMLRAFELDGADVTWPFEVKVGEETVEQIDGVVYAGDLICVLECKDTGKPENVEPIAKLRNQLLRRPSGVLGLLASRSGFTSPARTLAQFLAPQAILLWEGGEIDIVLQQESIVGALRRKYRYCVEYGMPDYTIQVETADDGV
jgi:hypothetical protein